MTVGAVLALDLATTTGWAWHRPGMPRPFFGAERLPGGPKAVGEPCDRLERFLRDLFVALRSDGTRITHFFFEAQHVSAKVSPEVAYRLFGLGAIVEKFAFQVGSSCYKVSLQEWRKHFIGRGAGFKRTEDGKRYLPGQDPKELAIQRCAQYGWHTDIADAAEALGILDYSLTLIDAGLREAKLGTYERPWRDNALMGAVS